MTGSAVGAGNTISASASSSGASVPPAGVSAVGHGVESVLPIAGEPRSTMTPRFVLTVATASGAAALLASVITVIVRADVPVNAVHLIVVGLLMALCLAARVPVGLGRDLPRLTWGELGLMAGLVLLPGAWVAVAAGVAALIGNFPGLVARRAGDRARARIAVSATVIGAGTAVAAAAGLGAGLTTPLPVDLTRPDSLAILLASVLSSFLVTTLLSAAWIATAVDGPVLGIWRRFATAGLPLLAAALLLGLAGVIVVGVSQWWLAFLAPMFWVLHRLNASRVKVLESRRIWAALAEAAPALQAMDEAGVRTAVLRGAAQLFTPDQVELVLAPDTGRELVVRAPAGPPIGSEVYPRRLVVGDVEIGELRLRFRRPTQLTAPEQDALLAFGDAAASALHDAATHRQLQSMTAMTAYEAGHDPITGLSNRFTLLARGNAELRRARPGQVIALVVLDIDEFRHVNDAMGHAAGDTLLRELGRRLSGVSAEGELLGSLGGDEFALLIPDVAGDRGGSWFDTVVERARSIVATLAEPIDVGGVGLVAEVSVGVVVETDHASDLTELLRRADLALRQARREGSRIGVDDGRYEGVRTRSLVPPGVDQPAPEGATPQDPPVARPQRNSGRPLILADLRDALATTEQLPLHIQPIVDIRTGQPVGGQAMVYWRHPRYGLLAPDAFLHIIEHSDMATGFSAYSVDRAVAAAAQWSAAGIDLPIAIRLCSRCTANPELPALITDRLAHHRVSADRLVVEISEGVMEAQLTSVEVVIAQLREIGVQVSVCDFGAAAASLAFLARIPVDEVRIDPGFVAAMGGSPQTDAIIRTTVELARELGLRVVAAGVSTAEQRRALAELGVGAAQGPLFALALELPAATVAIREMLARPPAIS